MICTMDPTPPHQPTRHARPGSGHGPGPLVDSMTMGRTPATTARGNPIVPPDPGTPASRKVALLLAIVLATVAIVWQNMGQERQQRLIGAPPTQAEVAQAAGEPAPGSGTTDLMARAFLRVRGIMTDQPGQAGQTTGVMGNVEATVAGDADRVRATIVAAEYLGTDAALERVRAHRADLAEPLAADGVDTPAERAAAGAATEAADEVARANRALIAAELDALETIYTEGPDALDDAARTQLAARYGTLGEFALSHGRPEPERDAIVGGPLPLLLFGAGAAGLFLTALLIGLGLLAWGLVWFLDPRRRMLGTKPEPGGSVMLETYAVFVGGFALLAIGTAVAEARMTGPPPAWFALLQLAAQWSLMLAVLWPLVRGMHPAKWRQALGLHAGEGVGREVVCGVLAYLAFIPVYVVGVVLTMVLLILWQALRTRLGVPGEPAPPNNPIVEIVGQADVVTLILIFTLATVWAPITEELVFRGALFRHFRARVHWSVAALGSAVLFAYLHSYGPLMVAPLIVLGFAFAFMREWRGSIIAPMTAHFLHNFTMLVIMVTAFAILG